MWLFSIWFSIGLLFQSPAAQDTLFHQHQSPYAPEETVERLDSVVQSKGLKVFTKIEHHRGAASVDLSLRPTTTVIFGNPKVGTLLMQCDQRVGFDLPLKMLVWEDPDGQTMLGYYGAEYLDQKYELDGLNCRQTLNKVKGALQGIAEATVGG